MIQLAKNGDQDAVGDLVAECSDYLKLIANHDFDRNLQAKVEKVVKLFFIF